MGQRELGLYVRQVGEYLFRGWFLFLLIRILLVCLVQAGIPTILHSFIMFTFERFIYFTTFVLFSRSFIKM